MFEENKWWQHSTSKKGLPGAFWGWSTAARGGCRLGMVRPRAEVALGHPHTYKM